MPGGIEPEPLVEPLEPLWDPRTAEEPEAYVHPLVAQSDEPLPEPWQSELVVVEALLVTTQPPDEPEMLPELLPERLDEDADPLPELLENDTPRSSAEIGEPGMRSGEHEAIATTSDASAAPTARPAFIGAPSGG